MLGVINNLNSRIYALNHQGAYYNTPPVNYGTPPVNYAAPLASNLFGGGYNQYGTGYPTAGYPTSNPTLGALTGLVGPLLGLPPY